jgi:hypothetical protein
MCCSPTLLRVLAAHLVGKMYFLLASRTAQTIPQITRSIYPLEVYLFRKMIDVVELIFFHWQMLI